MSPAPAAASRQAPRRVVLGKVGAPFGVRGWVRVYSQTDPIEKLLDYPVWQLAKAGVEAEKWQEFRVVQSQRHSSDLVVQLSGVDGLALADRSAAARLANSEIAIWRSELPALPKGEFYWTDLIGLEVVTVAGVPLGAVEAVMQTGANDVMKLRMGLRERLVPFVRGPVVKTVDVSAGCITVDWDPEF